MSDNFESKRLSSGSLGIKASLNELSFATLFSDEGVGDDLAVSFTLASSEVAEVSASPSLITLEIEVVSLNREEAQNLIKTHHTTYSRDPSNVKVKDHLAHGAQMYDVSWLKPFDISLTNKIHLKGVSLVELADANKYS